MVKNLLFNAGNIKYTGSIPGWRRYPGEGHEPTLAFLLGESHGERSLVGYGP